MTSLASGDTDVRVSDRARRDEIGAMAQALEVFRDAIYTHLEAGDVFLWVSRHKQLAHHECDHPETFCWCGWGRMIARCTATRPATARRRRPRSCCAPAAMSA